jgi:ATP-dependent Lon protease
MPLGFTEKDDEESSKRYAIDEMMQVYAVLPVKNTVIFPGVAITLNIGEERSKKLLSELKPGEKIVIASLKDIKKGVANHDNIYDVGILASVLRMVEGDDVILLVIHGEHRVRLESYEQIAPYFKAKVSRLDECVVKGDDTVKDLVFQVKELGKKIIKEIGIPKEVRDSLESINDPGTLADLVASTMKLDKEKKQEILETVDVKTRLEKIVPLMMDELRKIELSKDINKKVSQEMDKSQREFYLRQQLKAISEELNEDGVSEIDELEEKIKVAGMPGDIEEVVLKELKRLSKIPTNSAEYTVARTYIAWLLDMPWSKSTEDNEEIERAREILEDEHYGLKKVKKRILEYLAVKKLKKDMGGPILCFVGPPGVGKTSIANSVADALGRKFVRISLGGVRDEAEIRGHRRTYVGALPGRIIQGIKKAGTNNPVMLIDEIDKVGYDYRGDPSSALLEALDPEQNSTFSDHYLEVPFDLSKVLFITTANMLDTVPAPLKDRMEIIDFPGYTQEEKLMIAKKHLIPRQLERHGLKEKQVSIDDETVLTVIESYTKEAGVRNLERELATVLRVAACKIAEGHKDPIEVTREDLKEYLGPKKFRSEIKERTMNPGVSTGLAWTPTGGEILFIESNLMPGKKGLILTGQLGDVMKESAQAALSYVKAHAEELDIDKSVFEDADIHIHVPAGAIPKDGPSAGVAMTTALISLLKNKPVRNDIAMTGEITLKGKILPVGGIKEKALGAQRAGIDTVYLPKWNEKDLSEIPEEIKKKMKFRFVESVDEILEDVFLGEVRN